MTAIMWISCEEIKKRYAKVTNSFCRFNLYWLVIWMLYVMQRYGQGPEDTLPMEGNGVYTRTIGNLNFAKFTSNVSADNSYDNLLNNIWYQREQIFTVDGTPEQWKPALWSPVDRTYYNIATRLLVSDPMFGSWDWKTKYMFHL